MDWAESDGSENAGQVAVNLSFSQRQSADEAIVITDTDGKVVFAYDPDKDEVAGATRAGIPVRSCPRPVSPSAANIISASAATSRARRSPASMTPIASRASRRTPSSSAGPARARSAASAEVPAASAEVAGGFDPSGGNGGFEPNGGDAAGEGEVVFSLCEKVNGFTGVRDTE